MMNDYKNYKKVKPISVNEVSRAFKKTEKGFDEFQRAADKIIEDTDKAIKNAEIAAGKQEIKDRLKDLPYIRVTASMATRLTLDFEELKNSVYLDIIGAATNGKSSIRYSWGRVNPWVVEKLCAQLIEDGYTIKSDAFGNSDDYVVSWDNEIKSTIDELPFNL